MAHQFRLVQSGDCTLRVAVQGSGPLVLMVHGWPESWYSWRHQMGPIADAGFTAAAMDVRGYGGSSRPHPVEAYDMQTMVTDLQAVADQLGGGRAILIGHDWGAPIVWNSAVVDRKRFPAVAGLAVPYAGVSPRPLIDIWREKFTARNRYFYQIYIQDEGKAEAEMEADTRGGLRKIYYALSGDAPPGAWPVDKLHGDTLLQGLEDPAVFPAWLTDADIDYFVSEFEASGFRGPFNRYRNHLRDHAWQSRFADQRITQPALFIVGDRDMALGTFGRTPEVHMRAVVPGLRGFHILPGCGHWTQQERPAEVNTLLLGWLNGL